MLSFPMAMTLIFTSALLIVMFFTMWFGYVTGWFDRPAPVLEGTPHEKPVRYSVLLCRAVPGKGIWNALREWDDILTLIEVRAITKEGRCYLAHNLMVGEVTSLVDAILNHEPFASVQVQCNKFGETFTMKEWKEFHHE